MAAKIGKWEVQIQSLTTPLPLIYIYIQTNYQKAHLYKYKSLTSVMITKYISVQGKQPSASPLSRLRQTDALLPAGQATLQVLQHVPESTEHLLLKTKECKKFPSTELNVHYLLLIFLFCQAQPSPSWMA